VDEDAMEAVVAIHNNMNESTWKQVLAWEERHSECKQPRTLKSFMGRPDELSPKAACKYYLGLASRPFDRHDWIVDRCGKEVRYIIDYYDVASARPNDRLPVSMHKSLEVSIYNA
jgi:cytochrome c heme-lyase